MSSIRDTGETEGKAYNAHVTCSDFGGQSRPKFVHFILFPIDIDPQTLRNHHGDASGGHDRVASDGDDVVGENHLKSSIGPAATADYLDQNAVLSVRMTCLLHLQRLS